MRRRFIAVSIFLSILVSGFLYLKGAQDVKASESAVSAAPDIKASYNKLNKAASEMTEVASRLKEDVKGYKHPATWDARQVSTFFNTISRSVSKINSIDRTARTALDDFGHALEASDLPRSALEKHRAFVETYQNNFDKFNRLYDDINFVRSSIIPNRSGAIAREAAEHDRAARDELKVKVDELTTLLEEWYPDPAKNDTPPNEGPDAPKPWQNVYMKEREPKTGGKHKPAYLSAKNSINYAPTAADTTQTIDTELIEELTALAATLNHDPIRIYEWVLNNIYYQPYYGSAKGAGKTYFDRAGNDFDSASLLIALLRESGIPCRYVYGTVRLTAGQANNIFGTDSAVVAATIIARGGTPATWDGFDLLLERCWVEAYVPYDNYRGTGSASGGDTWIPLDPAFKTYSYTEGMRVADEAIPDWTVFWKGFWENGVTQETAVDIYKQTIADYVAVNYPDKTIDDVPITRTIVPETLGILPLSLPYGVESVHTEYAEIPDVMRHKVMYRAYLGPCYFPLDAPSDFDVTIPTVTIYTRRTTVGWIGATPEDQATIDSFGGLFSTPAYLVDVVPAFYLDGEIMTSGYSVVEGQGGGGCGYYGFWLRRYSILPAGVEIVGTGNEYEHVYQIVKNPFGLYEIVGIGHDFYGYSDEYIQKQINRLEGNRHSLNYDDVFGQVSYLAASLWYNKTYYLNNVACDLRHVTNYPNQLATALVRLGVHTTYFMGGLVGLKPHNYTTDAAGVASISIPLHANDNVDDNLSKVRGCTASQYEGFIYRDLFGVPPVSAVTIIQRAYELGLPVDNGWTDLDLNTNDIYIRDVNHPCALFDVDYYSWYGTGWIADEMICNSIPGGYIISGNLHGGGVGQPFGARFLPQEQDIYIQAEDSAEVAIGSIYDPGTLTFHVTISADLYRCTQTPTLYECSDQIQHLTQDDYIVHPSVTPPYTNSNHADFKVGQTLEDLHQNDNPAKIGTYLLSALYTSSFDLIGAYTPEVVIHVVGQTPPDSATDIFTLGDTNTPRPNGSDNNFYIALDELGTWSMTAGATLHQIWTADGVYVGNTLSSITAPGEYIVYYTGADGVAHWVKVHVIVPIQAPEGEAVLVVNSVPVTTGAYATYYVTPYTPNSQTNPSTIAMNSGCNLLDIKGIDGTSYGADFNNDSLKTNGVYIERAYMVYYERQNQIYFVWLFITSIDFTICNGTDTGTNPFCACSDTCSVEEIIIFGNLCDTGVASAIRTSPDNTQHVPTILSVDWTVRISDTVITQTTTGASNVKNAKGEYIPSSPTQFSTVWDTRDASGNLVPEGRYPYTVVANINNTDGSTSLAVIQGVTYVTRDYPAVTGNNNITVYDSHLMFNFDGSITWLSPNAERYTFEFVEGGGYNSIDNDNIRLTQTANGYEIATKDRSVIYFNAPGQILHMVDRNGNSTAFNYTEGRITSVVDGFGHTTSLAYNAVGRIYSIRDSAGKTETYFYDNYGNRIKTVHADGTESTYNYNAMGRLISKTNCCGGLSHDYTYTAMGKIETITDANGAVTSFAYDTLNRITYTTNPLGNVTMTTKNRYGNVTEVVYPNGATASYLYDERNLIKSTDPSGNETLFTYDANNNVTSVTDPEGRVTTFVYDTDNNLISTTNPLGHTSSFTYDTSGNLLTKTDPLGNTTAYAYDSKGQPTSVTAPNGATTSYFHNSTGELVKVIDAEGNETNMAYNQASSVTVLKDALNNITSIDYDVMERITRKTDALGNISTFTYNGLGSVTSATDAEGKVTNYTYDPMQRLISETAANGDTTAYAYDANGNLLSVTNNAAESYSYTYNNMNQPVSKSDFDGRVTSYQYDTSGRMMAVTKPDGTRIEYTYDNVGRMTRVTYPDGTTDQFTFDPATGFLTSASNAAGTLTFTYDAYGRLTSVHDSFTGKDVSYGYDTYSRLASMVYPTGRTISYGYDNVGRMNSISSGGTTYVTKNFDALSRISELTFGNGVATGFAFDPVSNLTNISTAGVNSYTYEYNKTSMKTKTTETSGSEKEYRYDPLYRINRVKSKVSGNTDLGETRYSYDATGNRASLKARRYPVSDEAAHENDSEADITAAQIRNEESYSYSAGNALTSISFDLKTNPTDGSSGSLWLDGEDDGEELSAAPNTGSVAFTYDANGNTLTKSITNNGVTEVTSYEYDYHDQLIKVTMTDSSSNGSSDTLATYKYDVFGRRVEKKVVDSAGSVITWKKYLYSGEDIICEYNFDGTTSSLASEYIHDAGVDNVVAMVKNGATYYYHKDALGSVTAITDSAGTVVKTYTYKTFGTISEETGTLENPYTYTGREYDAETGLYYYRARYYDSALGRFIQKDPIGIAGGMNVYAYVGNNPGNYVDPWGEVKVLLYCDQVLMTPFGGVSMGVIRQVCYYYDTDKSDWAGRTFAIGIYVLNLNRTYMIYTIAGEFQEYGDFTFSIAGECQTL